MISTLYNLTMLGSVFSNYSITNAPNQYNLMIAILTEQTKEEQLKTIEKIKIHMGISFWNQFREYVLRKFRIDSDMAKLVA